MSFSTPLALLLLLLLPYFGWLGWPQSRLRRGRDWAALVVRLLILLLLILSLAGMQLVRTADELAVVFLVDASDSISEQQAQQAETFVRDAIGTMAVNDETAVILFGANALVERPMSGLAELAPISSVPQQLHTDMAEAIRLGLALFPTGSARRLVILSDGNATIGDATAAARLAAANGVEIDYVYLSGDGGLAEAFLVDVDAPTRVSLGETFRLDVAAQSNINTPATLRVLASGAIIHEESVSLRPGDNNFSVRLRATEQEFTRYRVQLVPETDSYFQNNELAAFTEIVGAPRVLLVANDGTVADDGTPLPDESPQIALALQATGLEVDRITPEQLPADLGALSNYASVVLVNVNAKNLSPRKMQILQSYVRDLGGGLVAVGGPQSYGMGGYFGTPLEETLPVDMQIKDQDRFPGVSMAIVIDRSGSMAAPEGGVTKIQLAAEGAVRVVQLLNDFDDITVIPVDTAADNQIGPLPASDKNAAIGQIRQIGAGGGGIFVRTGIEAAAAALAQSSNEVKHIIVLADGADAEQKEGVPQLIEGLVAEGITVSMVSIGDGPDVPWLQEMAVLGNGRFHFTNQAANLPQIFTQETTSIQRSYLIEERFFPDQVTTSPILTNIRAVPPLYGYVGASPKDTAQVILNTHQGDPLLATWQYGLGRSVAWTSDATGRWASDWVQWEGFPVFWAQAVRWTVSQSANSNVETIVTFTEESAELVVDARNDGGTFLNDATLEANVVNPSGEVSSVTLQQVAPGRYESSFVPEQDGAYFIRVAGGEEGDEAVVGQTSGWVLGYSPEYRQVASDPTLLANLAAETGGSDISGDISAVFAHDLPNERTARPIWPWLLLAAVLLLPVDVALRRLVITRRDWERAWGAVYGRLAPTPTVSQPRSEQVSRLFEAKQRAESNAKPSSTPAPHPQQAAQNKPPSKGTPPKPQSPQKPSTTKPPTSAQSKPAGTLASRLLKKKQSEESDN